uniref:Uncharacterized protein n=1 Tax=Solanum lycopersicum TaxID=4081 RepID=A0A3Q7EIX3_SOLLC
KVQRLQTLKKNKKTIKWKVEKKVVYLYPEQLVVGSNRQKQKP